MQNSICCTVSVLWTQINLNYMHISNLSEYINKKNFSISQKKTLGVVVSPSLKYFQDFSEFLRWAHIIISKEKNLFFSCAKDDLNSYIRSASQSVLTTRKSKIHQICSHYASSGWNSSIHSPRATVDTKSRCDSVTGPVLEGSGEGVL